MNNAAVNKPFSRRTPEQWQQIINNQEASGLPQKAYCRQHGLSLATFCSWKKRLACHQSQDTPQSGEAPSNDWIEMPVPKSEPQPHRWDMELELPGGVTLRMRQA